MLNDGMICVLMIDDFSQLGIKDYITKF